MAPRNLPKLPDYPVLESEYIICKSIKATAHMIYSDFYYQKGQAPTVYQLTGTFFTGERYPRDMYLYVDSLGAQLVMLRRGKWVTLLGAGGHFEGPGEVSDFSFLFEPVAFDMKDPENFDFTPVNQLDTLETMISYASKAAGVWANAKAFYKDSIIPVKLMCEFPSSPHFEAPVAESAPVAARVHTVETADLSAAEKAGNVAEAVRAAVEAGDTPALLKLSHFSATSPLHIAVLDNSLMVAVAIEGAVYAVEGMEPVEINGDALKASKAVLAGLKRVRRAVNLAVHYMAPERVAPDGAATLVRLDSVNVAPTMETVDA